MCTRFCRIGIITLFVVAALAPETSSATTQRTFVASTGNDGNPCSIVAPCRSFAVAITQTTDGDEIIVLDSAGYAPVTVDRSVTLVAPAGVYAGITAFSGDAITITGTGLRVLLSGLTINALGGNNGVHIQADNSDIRLERVAISGFSQAGIDMMIGAGNGTRLYVEDSVIRTNQNGIMVAGNNDVMLDRVRIEENSGIGAGIVTHPRMHVRYSVIERNGSFGLRADSFGANPFSISLTVEGSTVRRNATGIEIFARQANAAVRLAVSVSNSVVSENVGVGVAAICADVSVAAVTVAESTISGNGSDGVTGTGTGCTLSLSHNVIANNAGTSMVNSAAGLFGSFMDNRVHSNGTDTPSGTITALATR